MATHRDNDETSLRADDTGIASGAHEPLGEEDSQPPAHQNAQDGMVGGIGGAFDFTSAGAEEAALETKKLLKVVAASMVGNILEWYDFGVFAYVGPPSSASPFHLAWHC